MILYEYEGKQLLSQVGITVPKSQLISDPTQKVSLNLPVMLKAQVLSGKRAQAGGIIKITDDSELSSQIESLFTKTINDEPVKHILVEEMMQFQTEHYLSISYDTVTRGPILTYSSAGGTGIEERGGQVLAIDPITKKLSNADNLPVEPQLIDQLIEIFFSHDCLLLEINPLVQTESGEWVALDAKVKLDDSAASRHPEWADYSARSAPGHTPTLREIAAKKIDENDYRGVAGSAFFDLDGDIAIMASGGGASITAMDTLIREGGLPANYTEYGGNPPKEKVAKLTQVVLDKPGLNGLWVVGALANFTNVYETLSGFIDGLRQAETALGHKFDFPIVIRRAGPHDQEAREMLSKVTDFDLHVYGEETSIIESAKIIVKLAKEYSERNKQ